MRTITAGLRGFVIGLVLCAVLALPLPARAQFADQQTYAGTAGGTANAITLAVPNWQRNLPGVPIRFLPSADNTSSATVVVNSVGSATAILKPSNAGLVALTGGELRSGQETQVVFDGTQWVLWGQLGKFVDASALAASALDFGVPRNLRINAAVSANQLTVSIVTAANANATATTPIPVLFRDATIANGDPVLAPIAGALSLTVASSNTMGCQSAVMCRLWVLLANDSGTPRVCLYNASSAGTSLIGVNEQNLQNSAAGTSGGSSAQTLYCSAGSLSSVPVRYVGHIDIQEATAGTWATNPTYVQLFGPGIKRPGETVNIKTATTTTPGNFTASSLTSVFSSTYTPQSAANFVRVKAYGQLQTAGSSTCYVIIYKGTTASPVGNAASGVGTSGGQTAAATINFFLDGPGNSGTTTYGIAGACPVVSGSGGTWLGTSFSMPTNAGYFEFEEIQG